VSPAVLLLSNCCMIKGEGCSIVIIGIDAHERTHTARAASRNQYQSQISDDVDRGEYPPR
jgi:hypothetical protein